MNDATEKPKVWLTTKEPNLLKNVTSGRFYARFKIAGKPKWLNLETDVWSVAVLRIAEERGRIARTRLAQDNVTAGVATMGELAKLAIARIDESKLNDSTKRRYREHHAAVEKTWPGFANLRPEKVTRAAVIEWRDRVTRDGTGFIPPGAKGRSKLIDGSSAAGINKMIDAIRRMQEIAVERGQLATNPLQGRGVKLRVTPKKPDLPEAASLEKIFVQIESRGLGRPQHCAELCRGLCYTGMRHAEAGALTWRDVNIEAGILRVRGTKTDSSDREVPLIPAARALFQTIHDRRLEYRRKVYGPASEVPAGEKVFLVSEASKALARACEEVGQPKLTHHDLRDGFATLCIESAVDIPTVAAWLGHKDGGALLMRTYMHHRRAHSQTQAAKVSIGGAA